MPTTIVEMDLTSMCNMGLDVCINVYNQYVLCMYMYNI